MRAFRTLDKRWLLSFTSLPPGETRVRGAGCRKSFFPQPASDAGILDSPCFICGRGRKPHGLRQDHSGHPVDAGTGTGSYSSNGGKTAKARQIGGQKYGAPSPPFLLANHGKKYYHCDVCWPKPRTGVP